MASLLKKVSAVVMAIVLIAGSAVNMNIYNVKAEDTVLTSSEISVVGYQMKTDVTSRQGVSFRAICKAPAVGSVITVDEQEYTVTNVGTIYTKDINTSGVNSSNMLDKSYTELDPEPFPSYAVGDYGFKYVGLKGYLNQRVTFGYIASGTGIIETSDGYSSYVRTLTNMDAYIRNSIFVRGFVEAQDAQGNDVLIYGEYAKVSSVAEIASLVYKQGKAPNKEGHEYIYNSILSKLPTTSPYYTDTEVEYGWSEPVNP